MSIAIDLQNVSKTYGDREVIHPLSHSFETGKIYGITGHNGSGKTMLFRLIAGLVLPTKGMVKVAENSEIGVIIEHPGFLVDLDGFTNLKMLAMIRNDSTEEEIKQAIRDVGLDSENKQPVRKYSLGMRQRLAIAQAIMEKQNILLLDEPLNGIDKEGSTQIVELLLKKKQEGATILLATHRAEEIAQLCDEVYEMNNGSFSVAK